jgi:carbon-monoxide dehydrogenase large subunit
VVATDCIRFVGECVALVVAETLAEAYDAVGLSGQSIPVIDK